MTGEGVRDKKLLAAKRIRRATSTEFIVSLVADDFSRASSTYVGKLRQVFLLPLQILFSSILIFAKNLYHKLLPGPTSWAPSLPYMIASRRHVMQWSKQIVDHLEGLILSRCLLEFQRVPTMLGLSLMNSIFFAQEAQEECSVLCTLFLSLLFRREALPQHRQFSHKSAMNNFHPHLVWKTRS